MANYPRRGSYSFSQEKQGMHAKLLDKIVAARLELTVLKGRLKCESIDLSREATADILYYIIVILEEAKELVENDE